MTEVSQFDVLSLIKYNGPVTAAELAESFGLELDDATTLVSKYVRQGLLRALMGIETKSDVRSRVSSRERVKKYVISGRGESRLLATT